MEEADGLAVAGDVLGMQAVSSNSDLSPLLSPTLRYASHPLSYRDESLRIAALIHTTS
jgi:hypothetical protein